MGEKVITEHWFASFDIERYLARTLNWLGVVIDARESARISTFLRSYRIRSLPERTERSLDCSVIFPE
jgi:hypothetical protein